MTVRVRSELVSFWCICSSVHQGSWLNCCHTAEMTVLTSDACTAGFHWFFLLHFAHISFALLHSVISYSADCCTFTALQYSLLYFTALFSQLFSASLFRPLMFLEFIQLWSVFSDAVSKWQKDTLVLCVSNVLTTCSVEWSVGVYHNVIRLWWKHFSCSKNTGFRGFRDTGTEWFLGLNIVPLMWTWENYSAYWLIIVFDALKILRIFCCGSIQLRDHCITMCCKTELLVFVTNSKWSYSVLFCQDLE